MKRPERKGPADDPGRGRPGFLDRRATQLLQSMEAGDPEAREAFFLLVEPELRRIAERLMGRQAASHTLQTTALANEACLRLLSGQDPSWRDRQHFLAAAARAMRHVLVDHARAARAGKRSAPGVRLPLEGLEVAVDRTLATGLDLVALDEALEELARFDQDSAVVVEMTLFGGYSASQIAESLGKGRRTVERDLSLARGWLYKRLSSG